MTYQPRANVLAERWRPRGGPEEDAPMSHTFEKFVALTEVPVGGCHALKAGRCPIVLFRPSADELYALENRCPHEGYPLSTGRVADGRLTCEWHNWKFRLSDGECVIGGEDVRTFPIEVRDGDVWIDVAPRPADAVVASEQASLVKAFEEGDFGHAARAVERLLEANETPESILAFGVRWGARHARWGFDHGLATAADFARRIAERPDEADYLIVDAFELIVQPNLRLPERPLAAPVAKDEAALRAAVESESLEEAEGIIVAACETREGARAAARWLQHAATDHFYDYGHGHIYSLKAVELLDAIGWDDAATVLSSLATTLVYGTREDRLPYMRAFDKRATEYFGRLPNIRSSDAPFDVDGLVAAVVDGSLDDALGATFGALDAGASPTKIALALALAASHRLLRFDNALESDPHASEGWLDVTHALTHADAVHRTLLDEPSPELLRGLFHSARFVQHLAPLDAARIEANPEDLATAVRAKRPEAAVAAVNAAPEDAAEVLLELAFEGRAVLPIFYAHCVKTTRAAERLTEALTAAFPERDDHHLPLAAAARFIASPLTERRMRRRVFTARTFVREGKMPRSRLGY